MLNSPYRDNIWDTAFANMHQISKCNKGVRFPLFVTEIYKICVWLVLLNDKNGIAITYGFQRILDEFGHQPNERQIEQGSEFYNRSMKSWLRDKNIEMYSTHNEVKSETFVRTLTNKIYKHKLQYQNRCTYISSMKQLTNATALIIEQ